MPRDPLRPAVFGRFRVGGKGTSDEPDGMFVVSEDEETFVMSEDEETFVTWEP